MIDAQAVSARGAQFGTCVLQAVELLRFRAATCFRGSKTKSRFVWAVSIPN